MYQFTSVNQLAGNLTDDVVMVTHSQLIDLRRQKSLLEEDYSSKYWHAYLAAFALLYVIIAGLFLY